MKQTLLEYLEAERGRASKLARILGVSLPTISMWAHGQRRCPVQRCLEIERRTQGRMRAEWIRPDVSFKRGVFKIKPRFTPQGAHTREPGVE